MGTSLYMNEWQGNIGHFVRDATFLHNTLQKVFLDRILIDFALHWGNTKSQKKQQVFIGSFEEMGEYSATLFNLSLAAAVTPNFRTTNVPAAHWLEQKHQAQLKNDRNNASSGTHIDCYDTVIRKYGIVNGDAASLCTLQEAAYNYCNISLNESPRDLVLFMRNATDSTRKFVPGAPLQKLITQLTEFAYEKRFTAHYISLFLLL